MSAVDRLVPSTGSPKRCPHGHLLRPERTLVRASMLLRAAHRLAMSLWRSHSRSPTRRGLPIAPENVGLRHDSPPAPTAAPATRAPCKCCSGTRRSPPPNGIARWTIPKSVRRWWQRYERRPAPSRQHRRRRAAAAASLGVVHAWRRAAPSRLCATVWRPCNG